MFPELFAAGAEAWERHRFAGAYHPFVPCDYARAAATLATLRKDADAFLELGSGVGVVTITAALLGYDAAGIEVEAGLVDAAEDLAQRFDAAATFAHGSFVPDGFDHFDRIDTEVETVFEGPDGYAELGRNLEEFDVVYAFPWPGTEEAFHDLVTNYGRPDTILLTYGATDGFRVFRGGDEV